MYVKQNISSREIFNDNNGHYIGVEISLQNKKILLVGIYGPQERKEKYYAGIFNLLSNLDYTEIIMMGDWNAVINPEIDRSNDKTREKNQGKLPSSFFKLMENQKLIDVWRHLYGGAKEYTFFSHVHQTFSRLDFFLASKTLMTQIQKMDIIPKLMSDHNPISLKLRKVKSYFSWRLNEKLLQYPENVTNARQIIKWYFEENSGKGTSPLIVWEASKAVLRGFFIKINSEYRKKREQKMQKVTDELRKKEEAHQKNPTDTKIQNELKMVQKQLSMLLSEEIEYKLRCLKQKNFQFANKSGKWLAYKLKEKKSRNEITKIQEGGKIHMDQQKIKKAFLKFYEKLYKQDPEDLNNINQYVQNANLIKIFQEQKDILNQPISTAEVLSAIQKSKSGSAPGPDGFTSTYYKTFQMELVDHLKNLMNDLNQDTFPMTWKEAVITLIPKEGEVDSSLDATITSLLINSSQPSHTVGKHNKKQFLDSSKNFKNLNRSDDELDSLCDLSQLDIEPEFNENFLGSNETQTGGSYSEIDITLPSSLTVATCCDYDSGTDAVKERVSIHETQELIGKKLIPSHFSQIYHELSIIHQKLQQEKLIQQEFALQLEKREHFLAEREALLCRHEAALTKIRDVEEEVHTKFQIMKEQHEAEIQQLSEALNEKSKENKRLKTSFETLRELNDTLKKTGNDVSEQNKKLEVQSRRVQARLENLQRKHEFLSIQKSKGASQSALKHKTVKPEKVIKMYKMPFNSHIYDLLTVLMEWISDQHLNKLIVEEEKEDIHKRTRAITPTKNYTQDKCIKCLPLVAEQLQWMPFVDPNLHFHVVKFIYWTLRQLDGRMQYAAMTSTMRRMGEDLFKGVVAKENQCTSSEHATDLKPKSAAFFKSCSLPLRVVSTLIIIKTVTQADYLAQAFDSLCIDLKTDEGKALFLDYEAVPIILSHIRISNKGLLSNAIDSLLQMTTESRFLHRFLKACSNEAFFRTCSVLLRNPKLDTQILEKLSILLQKLSKIKSNKKMFELFTIHLMIQELQRTAHPDHAFLVINLNSILFNLGLTKSHHLSNSLNQQQGALD
ncbi:coiled-coil domain-containing protein 138 [Sceloporus undulatus]|uniref:coiled-coil domain-containing protein 138 n=1 Tax=Sceloporus undulatus TaxID=8520 RepID=UPI001C4B8767|nr:coiled-coil domain-containing protein 138 [Sceloporus undulatus]